MVDFMSSVAGILSSMYQFLVEAMDGLKVLLTSITETLPFVLLLEDYTPYILGACISMVVGTTVVKFIIGR